MTVVVAFSTAWLFKIFFYCQKASTPGLESRPLLSPSKNITISIRTETVNMAIYSSVNTLDGISLTTNDLQLLKTYHILAVPFTRRVVWLVYARARMFPLFQFLLSKYILTIGGWSGIVVAPFDTRGSKTGSRFEA